MIFSQKITERGKPDPSECMSFLTARNLVSRIHRICLPCRVFGSSSGHLRIVFGLFGQRYPADQKARRLWVSGYEIGCARIGPSSETQGQSVGSGEKARRKFSSKTGRAPGYRLSPNHFQKFKPMLAPDWAQKMLCIIVPKPANSFS